MVTLLNSSYLYGRIDNETEVIMVGFADDELNPQNYLLLQKSLLPCSNEERELGFDKVHLTFCDESRSAYCDVENVLLEDGEFRITLSDMSAAELGTNKEIIVNFPKDSEEIGSIREILQKMFLE
jgi:hypothetical protein